MVKIKILSALLHRLVEYFGSSFEFRRDFQLLVPPSDIEFHELGQSRVVQSHSAKTVEGLTPSPSTARKMPEYTIELIAVGCGDLFILFRIMRKYRIITNGYRFRVQFRSWGIWRTAIEETYDRDGMLRKEVEYLTEADARGWIESQLGQTWRVLG